MQKFQNMERSNSRTFKDFSRTLWTLDLTTVATDLLTTQGAYKFWKIKFPKVSGFSRPSKRFFTRQLWSKNTDLTNHLSSQFGSFLAHRIFYLRCMMTGSIHASHCVTQPNYSTCYRKLCCQLDVQEIGLMSYNNKAAFKNVDKQHMLYCNTVTICDNIIFPE